MVWSTEVEVAVLGRTLARRIFSLPLLLAVSSSTPSREASLKITICTNQPTANLARLFAGSLAPPFGKRSSTKKTTNVVRYRPLLLPLPETRRRCRSVHDQRRGPGTRQRVQRHRFGLEANVQVPAAVGLAGGHGSAAGATDAPPPARAHRPEDVAGLADARPAALEPGRGPPPSSRRLARIFGMFSVVQ